MLTHQEEANLKHGKHSGVDLPEWYLAHVPESMTCRTSAREAIYLYCYSSCTYRGLLPHRGCQAHELKNGTLLQCLVDLTI